MIEEDLSDVDVSILGGVVKRRPPHLVGRVEVGRRIVPFEENAELLDFSGCGKLTKTARRTTSTLTFR